MGAGTQTSHQLQQQEGQSPVCQELLPTTQRLPSWESNPVPHTEAGLLWGILGAARFEEACTVTSGLGSQDPPPHPRTYPLYSHSCASPTRPAGLGLLCQIPMAGRCLFSQMLATMAGLCLLLRHLLDASSHGELTF